MKKDLLLYFFSIKSRFIASIPTWVEILIFIEHLLKPLLNLEGANGAQALERGREVGEDWTASLEGVFTQDSVA